MYFYVRVLRVIFILLNTHLSDLSDVDNEGIIFAYNCGSSMNKELRKKDRLIYLFYMKYVFNIFISCKRKIFFVDQFDD